MNCKDLEDGAFQSTLYITTGDLKQTPGQVEELIDAKCKNLARSLKQHFRDKQRHPIAKDIDNITNKLYGVILSEAAYLQIVKAISCLSANAASRFR
jgi:hypothetical protein